jgi:hypothetical protein
LASSVWQIPHVVEREAKHCPPQQHQVILSLIVPAEPMRCEVRRQVVALDSETELGPREVEEAMATTGQRDPMLAHRIRQIDGADQAHHALLEACGWCQMLPEALGQQWPKHTDARTTTSGNLVEANLEVGERAQLPAQGIVKSLLDHLGPTHCSQVDDRPNDGGATDPSNDRDVAVTQVSGFVDDPLFHLESSSSLGHDLG